MCNRLLTKTSLELCQNLFSLEQFISAEKIALYYPTHKEVNTVPIFKKAKELDKEVYFPRVNGDALDFIRGDYLSDLKTGSFNIPEPPIKNKKINVQELDLIFVPGIAFDTQGFRIGYGRGYFDKSLAGVETKRLWGLSYSFQFLSVLPHSDWDIKLGYILTEDGLYRSEISKGG